MTHGNRYLGHSRRLRHCLLGAAVGVLMGSVHAGGSMGGAGGGATEVTQLQNNIELVASVAKQAAMVEQQIVSNVNLIKHYATMTQNLRTLSPQSLSQALAVYNSQVYAFQNLQRSVGAIQRAATSAYEMQSERLTEANALGLDMPSYLRNEVALANTRGGAYRQRLDQDYATIQNLSDRALNLQQVSASTAGVTGNVQGLQNLSQISSIAAGELMEVKAALVAQNMERSTDRAAQAQTDAYTAVAAQQMFKAAQQRKARADKATVKLTSPWELQ